MLDDELIGWLTTVTSEGQPQSSAVWYVVDGEDILVYSRPDATRMRNLAANRQVAFNLRGDRQGNTIVTMEGQVERDSSLPPPGEFLAYRAKYEVEIRRLGLTPKSYSDTFSVPLRIKVTRIRAW